MIKVIAKGFFKEENIEKVIELYAVLVEASRKEEGCIKYELYQDVSHKNILTMIEEWENEEALKVHFNTNTFKSVVGELQQFRIKESDITTYTKLI